MNKLRWLSGLALVAAGAAPATAGASTTLGATAPSSRYCTPYQTFFDTSYVVPEDGVINSFSVRATPTADSRYGRMQFAVVRPGADDPTQVAVVQASGYVFQSRVPGLQSFAVGPVDVKAGDLFGVVPIDYIYNCMSSTPSGRGLNVSRPERTSRGLLIGDAPSIYPNDGFGAPNLSADFIPAGQPALSVTIALCPDHVLQGSNASVDWTATDSGTITGDRQGTTPLSTSTLGPASVTVSTSGPLGQTATRTCAYEVVAAPSAPRNPRATAVTRGLVHVSWVRSTTRSGGAISYVVQRRSAAGDWTSVPRARVTLASGEEIDVYDRDGGAGTTAVADLDAEPGGRFVYRIIASAKDFDSAPSVDSGVTIVDDVPPNPPNLAGAEEPKYTSPAGDVWYDHAISVLVTGNGDQALADGTAGSGVKTPDASVDVSTEGLHTIQKTVVDFAGNRSAPAILKVGIDTQPPTVKLSACTSPLALNASATLKWTASDRGSGLSGEPSGTEAVDTSTPGVHTAMHTVTDNIGNETAVGCVYTVR